MSDDKLSKLLAIIKKHYPSVNLQIVKQAYEFAEISHGEQMRRNKDLYFNHAYNTAILLAEWKMPPIIVTAGLLHDIPEDTPFTIADIARDFGKDIANIVEGETKLSHLKYRGAERYAENLRKMFFALAKDVRIIIVKAADRVDNLKSLDVFPPEKQGRIALESLEIYAPVANRLGMGVIRRELEDGAFKYVYPKEYEWVVKLAKAYYPAKQEFVEQIRKQAAKNLQNAGIKVVDIHGRTKGLYSLYKKLLRRERDISRVYDIVACRIIVPTVGDCYAALGVIHSLWKPIKGRIKDYIAQPKPNGYQSLHTTVFCDGGEIVEFQIRTEKMHEEAEFGLAAHWFYKERGKSSPIEDKHIAWLKELAELQKEITDRSKFLETLESLKIDMFQNRIFVFTPKGDVIDLPEEATPVDFAYAIHTEVGNKCIGAKVNEQMSSLDAKLLSGDVVEIIIDKNRKGPSPDWLKFVKTRNAREKIKSQIKKFRLGNLVRGIFSKKNADLG